MKDVLLDFRGYRHYRRFTKRMNQIAGEWGMTKTHFRNPSGASWNSRMSPKDLTILGGHAIENALILHAWQQEAETIEIQGTGQRTVRIVNTVLESGKPTMGDYLIGGKSGSWGTYNKSHLFLCRTKMGDLILSVFAKDEVSFEHIYDIGDELCRLVEGEETGTNLKHLIQCGGGYCIAFVGQTGIYDAFNADEEYIPASVTKVMTALVALMYHDDLNSDIIVRPIDISSGSGSHFTAGVRVRLIDAISIMLLESSNTMANAIARTIGSEL